MKVAMVKEEIAHLDMAELRKKLNQLRHELFGLRINFTTSHVKDYSQFKKIRKDIARVLTVIQKNESVSKQVNS